MMRLRKGSVVLLEVGLFFSFFFVCKNHKYIESCIFVLLPACTLVFFTAGFEVTVTFLTKCADSPW